MVSRPGAIEYVADGERLLAPRRAAGASIFVIVHDGHTEGFSGPVLAVADRDKAIGLAKLMSQSDMFAVFEVPLYPALSGKSWWEVEPIWPEKRP